MESSRAEQSNAQHSEQSSKAEQSNAQHSRAEQSRAEHRLSTGHSTAEHSTAMQSSCLVFLISSFCILLFYVSASVSCCCLKSFCDAYQFQRMHVCCFIAKLDVNGAMTLLFGIGRSSYIDDFFLLLFLRMHVCCFRTKLNVYGIVDGVRTLLFANAR